MKKISRRQFIATMGMVAFAGALSACGSASSAAVSSAPASAASSAAASSAASGAKYKVALSNSFMGNDWRQIMIKCAEVGAKKEPYASKLDLTVINSENNAEAQSAAIDALVEQGYNAILIDAASSSALIPSVNRALDAGIVVVSFDSTVVSDGVYTVQTDFVSMVKSWAKYLCEKCGKGAKIAVDTGMPGSTNGNTIYEAAMSVFKDYGMNVVSEFASQYADGVCQEQLASVLAANPDLQGIFCQAYVESCYSALTQAGMKMIPICAFDTNLGMRTMLENDLDAIIGNNCPGQSIVALDIAVRLLDGEPVDQNTLMVPGLFVNKKDAGIDVGLPTEVVEEGVNCWTDVPDGMDWPALPSDFTTISLDISEISDYTA